MTTDMCLFVIAALLCAAATGRDETADGGQLGKEYYWNVGGKGMQTWNTSHDLRHNVHNGRVVILSTWFGAYPELVLTDAKTGKLNWCNGGIPQLANLTDHIAAMERDIRLYFNDLGIDRLNFTGYIVNDYESWVPSWLFTPLAYKNASMQWTQERFPHLSGRALEEKAKAEYEAAAIKFLVVTMQQVQKHAPKAVGTGFYGYPHWTFWGNKTQYELENARWTPLWEAVTAFYPSLYMFYESGVDIARSRNLDYMRGVLEESDRVNDLLVSKGHARRAVLPYTWYRYHPGEPHGWLLLTDTDLCVEFDFPFTVMRNGTNATRVVDGVIIWGDEATPGNVTTAQHYLQQHETYFGANAPCHAPTKDHGPGQATVGLQQSRTKKAALRWAIGEQQIPPYHGCSL